jgi:hypothetical protein
MLDKLQVGGSPQIWSLERHVAEILLKTLLSSESSTRLECIDKSIVNTD